MAIFLNDEQTLVALDPDLWQDRAEAVTRALALDPATVEWSLTFTTDEAVHDLNRTYRDIDRSTDVLSFAQEEGDDDFPVPEGGPRVLGDVVIAVPTATRQAAERGHAAEAELGLLMIHGLLHLLGHDHDTAARKQAMWAEQQRLLDALGLTVRDFGDAVKAHSLFESFRYAAAGIYFCLRTQRNMRIHVVAGFSAMGLGSFWRCRCFTSRSWRSSARWW